MKNAINNLKDGAGVRRAAFLVPFALLPIGLMGITTPAYFDYVDSTQRETSAEAGNAYAQERRAEWHALGSIGQRIGSLQELNQSLGELIPAWQEELTVHGAIRDAALAVGLELSRLQVVAPERIGEAIRGLVVVERVIVLTGTGSSVCAMNLVDRLRGQGWPTCVHSIDANVDISRDDLFGFELRLGIFHYAPAEDFLPKEDPIDGIPTIEEPI